MIKKEICWNITTRCNQSCRYCHRFLKIKDLSLKKNIKILNNLIYNGVTDITWTGGEALLLNGIDKLLEIGYNNGIKNKLITNGKLLNIDRIIKIGKYLDSIVLSIDSTDNLINEKLGRGFDHYNNVKEILDYLKVNFKVKIRINSVVCSYTKNEYKKLITFLNNYDIYSWRLFKFMPLRETAVNNKDEFSISLNEYNDIIKNVRLKSKIENIDSRVESDMEEKYILILANGDIVITQDGIDKKVGNALSDKVCFSKINYYKKI